MKSNIVASHLYYHDPVLTTIQPELTTNTLFLAPMYFMYKCIL